MTTFGRQGPGLGLSAVVALCFSSGALAETSPDIRAIHNRQCEINAKEIAPAAEKRGEFVARILAKSSPNTPQRDAFMEELKRAHEFTKNDAFERARKYRTELIQNNVHPAAAGAIENLIVAADSMAWTFAMEEPGLSAASYQRRIEQNCKQSLK